MKRTLLVTCLSVFFITPITAQISKPSQKAEGGIIFFAKKKSGLVVAEKILGMMSWDEGKKACEDLVLNGFNDWRLPSLNEIGLIYYELYEKGIGGFPTGYYWSKRENMGIRTLAWCFDFKDAMEYNSHMKTNTKYILAVRSYKK